MGKLKIAAQLYTVRDFTKDEASIAETLKKISKIGYKAVQLSAIGPIETKKLKTILDDNGLIACATHTPLNRLTEQTDEVIAEHKTLGIKYIGLGWYRADNVDGYKKFFDGLLPVIEKITAAGLKFVYHNHAHEFIKYDDIKPIDVIKNASPDIGLLADLYWLQAAGLNPAKFVLDNRDRINVVHFKDMIRCEDNTQTYAEIFNGNMDYEGIYSACVQAGVEWAAVEQDVCPGDPFASLTLSFKNLELHGMI